MSTTITYLPDMRTTPTPETPQERGLFTYDALAGFGGPEIYMEDRGRFLLACFAGPRMGCFTADDVLRELARDYADMTATYTPEKPLKVGDFDYDGRAASGPDHYMDARGLALLDDWWSDWDGSATCMRDVLEDLRHDYLACKRRFMRAVRANKPVPDAVRFFLLTETRESA